jgi:hypothetical protein
MRSQYKYHLNSKGEAGACTADLTKEGYRGCPFGGEAGHYETIGLARAAFEASHSGETISKATLKKTPKKPKPKLLTPVNFDDLPPKTRTAIKDYQGWNFDRWNDSLRRGDLAVETKSFQQEVKAVDRLIDDHRTEKDAVIYRSLKTEGGNARFVPEVGGIFKDRAYMSFSQNPEHQEFLEGHWYEEGDEDDDDTPCEYDLVIELELPKNSSALPMPMKTHIEKSEQEVLLPRDTQIKIVERIEESDVAGNPRIRLKGVLVQA